PYGAAVIGSAVYAGQWRKQAVSLLRAHEGQLRALPVWLFSSGPLGKSDPVTLLRGWRIPKGLVPLIERIGPRDVAVFHGALKVTKLAWWERTLVRMMKAPSGDFRNWTEVENWAQGIATALKE
ncbi:MAG: flavodoxin domain-containing protein, partial [Candidatus Oleimicrobiaceae bacterium]